MYLQITSRAIRVLYLLYRIQIASFPRCLPLSNEMKRCGVSRGKKEIVHNNIPLPPFPFFLDYTCCGGSRRGVHGSISDVCNDKSRRKIENFLNRRGGEGTMFNRIQGWQSVGRFGWTWANIEYRGWCVQVCKPAWNFHILFRVQSFHVESGRRARRQPPADGLNNRRRENEVEGKKKGGKARGNPASLVCFVIHRDIAESLLTEVSMILVGEKDSTRARPIMCEAGVALRFLTLCTGIARRGGRSGGVSMYFQYRDKAI